MNAEKQAWLTIAEAYATAPSRRTEFQEDLTIEGVCNAISELYWNGGDDMGITMRRRMNSKTTDCVPWNKYYFCPVTRPNEKLRALFCYLQYYAMGGE